MQDLYQQLTQINIKLSDEITRLAKFYKNIPLVDHIHIQPRAEMMMKAKMVSATTPPGYKSEIIIIHNNEKFIPNQRYTFISGLYTNHAMMVLLEIHSTIYKKVMRHPYTQKYLVGKDANNFNQLLRDSPELAFGMLNKEPSYFLNKKSIASFKFNP